MEFVPSSNPLRSEAVSHRSRHPGRVPPAQSRPGSAWFAGPDSGFATAVGHDRWRCVCAGLATGAIEAAVLAAGAAVPGKDLAQVPACAVQPHGEVVLRDPERRCQLGRIPAVQIDLLQQFPIRRRHQWQQTLEALAKQALVGR